jgi:2,3-dihydroxybenzoate-AMP ligase
MTGYTDQSRLPLPAVPRWSLIPHGEGAAERYRAAGLWRDATIPAALDEVVRAHPARPAVITSTARWTYAELAERSGAVAAGFIEAGLRPGETVILQLTNGIHTTAVWYGLLRAGLIPVCALASHRRHEIEQIARQTRAAAHVVQADLPSFDLVSFAAEIRGLVPGVRALFTVGAGSGDPGTRIEDLETLSPSEARLRRIAEGTDLRSPAVFQLSGGTTSTPKVIPRLHPEYWYNAVATARWWDLTAGDRLAYGLPLVHNAGIVNGLHAAHSAGAALLLANPDPGSLLPLMADGRATWVTSPPGLMNGYLDHPRFDEAFAYVRNCVLIAAPVPRLLFDTLEERGVHVVQNFGMTEGLLMSTPSDAPRELRARTVGVPISALDEVRLLRPGTLEQVPPGTAGELCARGPYTIRGYLDAPERDAEAFTPDGFYRSGDIVLPHDFGGTIAYSVEGRVKDLINRGGEKVNAGEVETLLQRHPAVAEAALVAMPDERLGERACAYLVVREDHLPPTLAGLCVFLELQGLAKFKWPERVEYVGALPRSPVGKILKQELRDDVAQRMAVR